jgi:pyridoxine/pyridoxamine 5'-phosphate oxidase
MMSLFQLAKTELLRANADRKHPFRTFWLGTFGTFPEVRTVVKRKTYPDLRTLFFTDSRSPKVQQMLTNPKVTALFYHPKKKLQVRVKGEACLVDPAGKEFEALLDRLRQSPAIKDYTTLHAPGTEITEAETSLFDEQVHFAAVEVKPLEIDILLLGEHTHERMRYTLEAGAWQEISLVP